MLSTRTYDEFIAQVGALCGVDFTGKPESRIAALGNLAAKRAYKESQWWERFLVASEPRTAARGRVDASEDSYYVFGAGTNGIDGLYTRNGLKNSKALYEQEDGGVVKFEISWSGSDWQILARTYITSDGDIVTSGGAWVYQDGDIIYDNSDTGTAPPSTGWVVNVGAALAPLLTDVADIDTFMQISGTDTVRDSSSRPISFYVDSSGANLRSNAAPDQVWVTYKKAHTDIYGDGTSGTVSDIPAEWFNYMTLYAAYMYQSSQRQNNPNSAYGLALREVENALQDELMRLEEQHITENLAKHVSTHLSQNQSLI